MHNFVPLICRTFFLHSQITIYNLLPRFMIPGFHSTWYNMVAEAWVEQSVACVTESVDLSVCALSNKKTAWYIKTEVGIRILHGSLLACFALTLMSKVQRSRSHGVIKCAAGVCLYVDATAHSSSWCRQKGREREAYRIRVYGTLYNTYYTGFHESGLSPHPYTETE